MEGDCNGIHVAGVFERALRASASELAGVDQRCGGAMFALSLYRCMERYLQLCSGLEHNHQKVSAG